MKTNYENLVQGGQGRSAESIVEDAIIVTAMILLAGVIAIIGVLL
jgi:hypothetical protein